MRLRDTTVVFICVFLGIMALALPMPVFAGPYQDIRDGEVAWTCPVPLLGLAPPDVSIDEVREEVEFARTRSLTSGQYYDPPSSRHPLCGGLSRVQVVLGLLALAGAAWRGRQWWRATADARAEKRFKRLHESVGSRRGLG